MASTHGTNIIWREDSLPADTRRALQFLSRERWLKKSSWYLAGGTALTLYEGHRRSVDLDFFTPEMTFSSDALLKKFHEPAWETDIVREGTVYGKLFGAKVSFIAYPFFKMKEPLNHYGTVRVLSPRDIAVMKVIAISQRGRKRDFIDLYWYITHHESLPNIVQRLQRQYPSVAHNYHHIVKSLQYFADADEDPMPKIFFKVSWAHVKSFFRKETLVMAKDLLRLE